ncbi:MAG: ribonuclease P protein component [Patescibacteria group bacterium]
MLPKSNRLKNKKDFDRVFKEGRGFKNDFLALKAVKNNTDISRFGFVVSQKVSKKAVIRNKIKRRLREIIKKDLAVFKNGIDIVLIVFPNLNDKDFSETQKIASDLFKKSGVIVK